MNPTGGVERGYHAAFIRLFYSTAETSRGDITADVLPLYSAGFVVLYKVLY